MDFAGLGMEIATSARELTRNDATKREWWWVWGCGRVRCPSPTTHRNYCGKWNAGDSVPYNPTSGSASHLLPREKAYLSSSTVSGPPSPKGKVKNAAQRPVHHSDKPVLNGSFFAIWHKKFPKCVSIPGILLFILQKDCHFKTA